MKPSKKILKTARKIAKSFDVKVSFSRKKIKPYKGKFMGFAYPWRGEIVVSPDLNLINFTTALFHEIQHCLNYRNGKYINYHKSTMTNKEGRRLGLRAEVYTDIQAKKLAKSFGFTRYTRTYKFNDYYRKMIKEQFP